MFITEALKREHKSIEETLYKMVGTDQEDPKVFKIRQNLLDDLEEKLVPHIKLEEEVVYSRLKEKAILPTSEILKAFEEHQFILESLTALLTSQLDSENWSSLALNLKRATEHHFKRECEVLFPTIEQNFTDKQLMQMKDEFMRERLQGWGSYALSKDHEYFYHRDDRARKI